MSANLTGKQGSQRSLGEYETLTSLKEWKNNLHHHLSQDPDFTDFLDPWYCWRSSSDAEDHSDVEDIDKATHLHSFLEKIANLCPSDLRSVIRNQTTCLRDVYNLIGSFYRITPSETSFMRLATIQRETVDGSLETPEHLFQRIRQLVKDNLLLSSGDLRYRGNRPLADEEMSPTTERLVVLRWLEVLNPSLPDLVARIFDKELSKATLADLQPNICEQMDQLLLQIEQENSVQDVNTVGSSNGDSRNPRMVEKCATCRGLGPNLNAEDIKIAFTSNASHDILQASSVQVTEHKREETKETGSSFAAAAKEFDEAVQPRIKIIEPPQYNVKINNVHVTMVLDTGCTGSLISLEVCKLAHVEVRASKHSAVQADGDSPLKVVGEVHTSILMDGYLSLPVNALVVSRLKAGFIVGMAFMKQHKVKIDMGNNTLSFQG